MSVGRIGRTGFSLLILVPALALACSDDDDGGSKDKVDGGAGTSSGGTGGSVGGASGASGASGSGGTAGQDGGSSGAGGSAGDCTSYGEGQECQTCLDQKCCAEATACANSAVCNAFVECGRGCPDHTDLGSDCMKGCLEAGTPGIEYNGLITCQGNNCPMCAKF